MYNHEELKRRQANNPKPKNSNSTNSLLSMKDLKKTVVSREK